MNPAVTQAVESGATVLAASQRLARVLTESFTAQQRALGKSVWKTPSILPWGGFLNRHWRDWLLKDGAACPLLLNPTQELAIWEAIIRESAEGNSLLQVEATARKALEAWELIQAYRLPVRTGLFDVSEDSAAFLKWAKAFEQRCSQNRWLEQARLPDVLAELIRANRIQTPHLVYLAGFDEFTPQQRALLEAFNETLQLPVETGEARPVAVALRDTGDELRQAAAWARERLDRNADAQIGIVVPDLTTLRSRTERVFMAVLHPGLDTVSGARAFHISLGAPLSDAPIVRAALLILELGTGEILLSRMGLLLRGPFLAGAERERSHRASLDARLRRRGRFRVDIPSVLDKADACPLLASALRSFEKSLERLPSSQIPSEWGRTFSRLLRAAGWPGDRTLSSEEFQASRAWNDLLSRFATLDLVTPRIGFSEALEQLRAIALDTLFQAEDAGARVQIMGLFESSGLRFDHLWVMGLHDEAVPSAARPNPFLPLELQKTNRLPHSSPARELEVAGGLMRRLREGAPELVFSYPKQQGDQRLGPSPFLQAVNATELPAVEASTWLERMQRGAALESVADWAAPQVSLDTVQLGGTGLLRDMAACHFRAWAQHRAAARSLAEPEAGISALQSGIAVHSAMEGIWNELRTHQALCALTMDERTEVIARHVRQAVAKTEGLGRALERQRLEKLLAEWLDIEKRRPGFAVIELEGQHEINLGGLRLKARLDRVDQLEAGGKVVLDYKTGDVKSGCWTGDRPDEPQLLLYASSSGDPISGAAFAQIRAGDLGFVGVTAKGGMLPGIQDIGEKNMSLDDQILAWRKTLHRLAEDFCAGNAEVNPKRKACDFCALPALCRVND